MIKSQHSRLFEQLLAQKHQELLTNLALGLGHDQYLQLAGQVQGLVIALRLSEEADLQLSGEK